MPDIIRLLYRFLPPYKSNVIQSVCYTFFATLLSLFSFATIIPVLQILFGISESNVEYVKITQSMNLSEIIEVLKNNLFYWLQTLIDNNGSVVVLLMLGGFLVVMTSLKCSLLYLSAYAVAPIETGVLRDLRQRMYEKILSLPLSFFTEEHKGDIMSRMTNDVVEVENCIVTSFNVIFKSPIMVIMYIAVLCYLSWELTIFVFVLLPLAGLLLGKIGKKLKRRSTLGQEQTAQLLTLIEETLTGLRVVKGFNAEEKLRKRFTKFNNITRDTFNKISRRYNLAHPLSEVIGTSLIAILIWYGGMLIIGHRSSIDAAEFIYYLLVFYSIISPVKDITRAGYGVKKGMASLDRIDSILNVQPKIVDPVNPTPLIEFNHAIVYENVCFSYLPSQTVLNNISLTIPKGQMIAFVGQSGSGKTTIADLLPRFYEVDKGKITIDGININNISCFQLRALMGIVNQNAILFNDTFYNNITFGVDTSVPPQNFQTWQEAVENAAKIAYAHDFITATPDGYQTTIGEQGSRLSGGQKQRISIARAILKNPPILILDEATSALDTESEKLVQTALDNLLRDRTTIVIAHRLSTIQNADCIYVINDGRIVESGKHSDLLNKKGYYHRLIQMQSKNTLKPS